MKSVDGHCFAHDTDAMILKFSPYIWLAAFLCSLFFIDAWQLQLFAAAVILISGWSVLSLGKAFEKGLEIPKSWCLGFMAGFWLLSFLSILGSDVLNVSVMAFCFFSALPLTFFGFLIAGQEKHYLLMMKIFGGVFAVLAIWALIQFVFLNEYFGGRARHPLKNPNSLAALFSLAFFCGVGVVSVAKKRKHQIGAIAFTVLVFAGVIATGSRGALFAMLPMIALLMFFLRVEVVKNWRVFLSVFALCAGAFILSYFGGMEKENLIVRVVDMAGASGGDLSNNRLALWEATWGIIKAHGLFGTGIGTYFLYFPEFRLPDDLSGAYYAHNDPMQFWVELGVLAPVLFYAFCISVAVRTIKAVYQTTNSQDKALILTLFFALSACVLHTHVTFNFYNLSILFIAGFLLSVWFTATQKILKTPVKIVTLADSYTPMARYVLVALPFVFIVGIFGAYIVSEHYTNKARDHLLEAELEDFAEDVLFANKISLRGNYRSYLLAVNVPMSILENDQRNATKMLDDEKRKQIFDQALNYLKHVEYINPRSASTFYYLGKLQQLVPETEIPKGLKSSQEYYERALTLDPIHVGARIELSHIYEKDLLSLDRALKLIEDGAKYRYGTAKALDLYMRQARLYGKIGEDDKRDQAMAKMLSFQSRLDRSRAKQEDGFLPF